MPIERGRNSSGPRAISVDIRYVMFITEKMAKAEHLLEEMGLRDSLLQFRRLARAQRAFDRPSLSPELKARFG